MLMQTEIEANRVRIRDMHKQGADHARKLVTQAKADIALREWQAARMCAKSGNTVAAKAHYRACVQTLKGC